jgi:tetratricopeptide (TPR) repeat protein
MKLKKIDTEFQKGLLSLIDGRYRDAIMSFDAVLILDSENTLARKYMQTAKEAMKQIREERVDADSPYYNIVNSLIVSGRMLYDRGEYTESRTRWEKILDLFPKNQVATEYLLRCNLKLNPQNFDESLEKIADDGMKLLKDKEYGQALRKFELVKSLSKKYPGIDDLIASSRKLPVIIKKEAAKAGPALPTASPAEIEGRIKNGIEYYKRGGKDNIEKALNEFKWVNERDPENTNALIYMNKIEAQLRVGTVETGTAAKRLTPKQEQLVKVHYFKGINYYFNNDFDQAISEWRKVLAIDPDHEKARLNIRKCLVLLKR